MMFRHVIHKSDLLPFLNHAGSKYQNIFGCVSPTSIVMQQSLPFLSADHANIILVGQNYEVIFNGLPYGKC